MAGNNQDPTVHPNDVSQESGEDKKVRRTLNVFVTAFVERFESKLADYRNEVDGKVSKEGSASTVFQGLGAFLGGVGGLMVGMPGPGASGGGKVGSKIGSYVGSKAHKDKATEVVGNFASYHSEEIQNLRKILVESGVEIFCNYEYQFMHLTTGDTIAIRELALDGVERVVDYNAKQKLSASVELVTRGLVLGSSKGYIGSLVPKRKIEFNRIQEFKTSSFFEKPGIVFKNKNSRKYFTPKGSKVKKYGYRLPFKWEPEVGSPISTCPTFTYNFNLQSQNLVEIGNALMRELNSEDPYLRNKRMESGIASTLEEVRNGFAHLLANQSVKKDANGIFPIQFDVKKAMNTFTRRQELEELHRKLEKTPIQACAIGLQIAVVTGMGGIGKTELARQYVAKYKDLYNGNIIWINAKSESFLTDSFFILAKDFLNIATKDANGADMTLDSVATKVYQRLSRDKCLFVFDEADVEDLVKTVLPKSFPTGASQPSILLTSRITEWGQGIAVFELNVFTLEDALSVLKNSFGNIPSDESFLNLVNRFQRFPLAIDQAIAYIVDENLTRDFGPKEYLVEFEQKSNEFLDSKLFSLLDNDYTKTTFTTWKITMEKISTQPFGEFALKILNVITFLASSNIRRSMFLSVCNGDENCLIRSVRLLVKYSLLKSEQKQSILGIHRLVQEVQKIVLANQVDGGSVVVLTLEMLVEQFPYNSTAIEDLAKKKQLLPHFEVFLDHVDIGIQNNPACKQIVEKLFAAPLLARIGDTYGGMFKFRKHLETLDRLIQIQIDENGKESDIVRFLRREHDVVQVQCYAFEGDVGLLKKTLDTKAEWENCHIQTMRALLNWNTPYFDALTMEDALENVNRKVSEDGQNEGLVLKELSESYIRIGDFSKASETLEMALPIVCEQFGSTHFHVGQILVGLGNVKCSLGEYESAKEMMEQGIQILQNYFGDKHFIPTTCLIGLSLIYYHLGQYDKRIELLERAVTIMEEGYGEFIYLKQMICVVGVAHMEMGHISGSRDWFMRGIETNNRLHTEDPRRLTTLCYRKLIETTRDNV